MPRAPQASHDVDLKETPPFDLASLSGGGPDIIAIDPGTDIRKLCEDEKFLHELIEIRCLATSDVNAPKAVEITVHTGGITGPMTKDKDGNLQPGVAGRGGKKVTYVFQRDKKYTVPRFIFEALAHAKQTTLSQVPHPTNPNEILQTQRNTFFYQFELLRDSNTSPKAVAWREKVLNDPA